MNGHPTPRRLPARLQHAVSSSPRSAILTALLVVALVAVVLAPSLVVAGCGSSASAITAAAPTTTAAPSTTSTVAETSYPVTVTDDNKKSVTIETKPLRIVSTAPASTETLFALGVGDRVVGVTSLDDYPPEAKNISKIGDFQPNTEAIMALSPDLVVGYSGNEEALAPVEKAGAPVIIFNPSTIDGVYANITLLGTVTGTQAKAAELVDSIKAQIEEISKTAAATGTKPRVFYALDNTLWTCGPGSFVDEMLTRAGCVNIGSAETPSGVAAQPYYQFTAEQLVAADPDLILLPSSSGYKSATEFTADARFAGLAAVKQKRVLLIDDTTVTRPGPRIADGLKVLVQAIHSGAL